MTREEQLSEVMATATTLANFETAISQALTEGNESITLPTQIAKTVLDTLNRSIQQNIMMTLRQKIMDRLF